MPTFQYRALTQVGEVVSGALDAPSLAEVNRRIEYLGLIPIEASAARSAAPVGKSVLSLASLSRPRADEVTTFTVDLALLMRTGARINDALEMLAADADIGRMRSTIAALATSVVSGESFGEAISRHPKIFPPIYVALVRVGETSGALVAILDALATERQRAEALSRRLTDTLRYPAFLLLAAGGVLLFFLLFVLPQFASVISRFQRQAQPGARRVPRLVRNPALEWAGDRRGAACRHPRGLAGDAAARDPGTVVGALVRLPIVRPIMDYRRTSLFCRNLGLLLSSGVTLTAALRILADTMEASGSFVGWSNIVDKVRHGGKLSDALTATEALPAMAISDYATWRGLRAVAHACRKNRRLLRGEVAAKP